MTREPRDRDVEVRLERLRVDPADDGFRRALHRRLAAAPRPEAPGAWARLVDAWRHAAPIPWPSAAALAAALAVAAALLARGSAPPSRTQEDALAAVRVPATRVAMVRLDLSVDVAVDEADIRVSLPDGLTFWSRGEALPERSFEWRQPLAAGRNEIPIAVRGLRPGRYHVTVTARVGDEWIAHDVPLQVTEG